MAESLLVTYSTLYLCSVHLSAHSLKNGASNRATIAERQLRYKGQALKLLRETLTHPEKGYDLDDTVGAILDLAGNEITSLADPTSNDSSPFMSPLEDAQWLSHLGAQEFNPAHWSAVYTLIKQYSGIRSIKIYGLAWLISL